MGHPPLRRQQDGSVQDPTPKPKLVGERLTPEQFGQLFQACSRRLWCIAAAVVGDRSRASDVLQESAVIALGKLDEFDPHTSFHAWMGQIVRFTALNEGRRRQKERPQLADPVVMDEALPGSVIATGRTGPVDSKGALKSGQSEFDDQVTGALKILDETARSCLLLRTVLDLSYREIAETLSIPEGTALSHVHRARKAMREHIEAHSGKTGRGA
jgi:RNA polymerase sigma-70 factor, ECF subfamily